jgi:hypothetical protein
MEQATASGFLDGSSFTNALVTATFFGDTDLEPGVLGINGTGSVVVTGIGSAVGRRDRVNLGD